MASSAIHDSVPLTVLLPIFKNHDQVLHLCTNFNAFRAGENIIQLWNKFESHVHSIQSAQESCEHKTFEQVKSRHSAHLKTVSRHIVRMIDLLVNIASAKEDMISFYEITKAISLQDPEKELSPENVRDVLTLNLFERGIVVGGLTIIIMRHKDLFQEVAIQARHIADEINDLLHSIKAEVCNECPGTTTTKKCACYFDDAHVLEELTKVFHQFV